MDWRDTDEWTNCEFRGFQRRELPFEKEPHKRKPREFLSVRADRKGGSSLKKAVVP